MNKDLSAPQERLEHSHTREGIHARLARGLVPLVSYLIAFGFTSCIAATGLVFFGIGQ